MKSSPAGGNALPVASDTADLHRIMRLSRLFGQMMLSHSTRFSDLAIEPESLEIAITT